LNESLSRRPFLAGERFSRADLSAAALLAPLCTPPEHPFPFPPWEETPEVLQKFRDAHCEDLFFTWTLKMYREHRG
jgi:glutathione S-transferase